MTETQPSTTVSEMVRDIVYSADAYIRFCSQFLPEEEPKDPYKERRRKRQESACIRACQRRR